MRTILICRLTGVQFEANLVPMGEHASCAAIHPYAYMHIEAAIAALVRVSQYNKVVLLDEHWHQVLVQLRLASFVLARHIGALNDQYSCANILLPVTRAHYGASADTLVLGLERDRTQEVHAARVDALSLLTLRDRYAGGLPKIAELRLGAFECLLNACKGILADELLSGSMLAKLGFDSSIAYELRTALPVQPAVFSSALAKLLPDSDAMLRVKLFHLHIVRKMRVADVPEFAAASEELLAISDTSLAEYEMVDSLPELARSGNLDIAVAQAITLAVSEYRRVYQAQYARLREQQIAALTVAKQPTKSKLPPFNRRR